MLYILPQTLPFLHAGWWIQTSVPSSWWMYCYPDAIVGCFSPTNRYIFSLVKYSEYCYAKGSYT